MTYPTIRLNTLLNKWNENPDLFNGLPEFSFIIPLAKKIKEKNCTCGLGSEIAAAQSVFNLVSSSLSEEAIGRMKVLFNSEKLCFAIESQTDFNVECH